MAGRVYLAGRCVVVRRTANVRRLGGRTAVCVRPAAAASSEGIGGHPAGPRGDLPPLHPSYDSGVARANLLLQLSDVDGVAKEKKKKTKKKKKAEEGGKATEGGGKEGGAATAKAKKKKKRKELEGGEREKPDADENYFARAWVREPVKEGKVPWTPYDIRKPGTAHGEPVPLDKLRWSPNGNARLQIDRQTIMYQQFYLDLLRKDVKEVHWCREGLDRYVIVYKDDRVAYCQVPTDEWMVTQLINRQGLLVKEITDEDEIDSSSDQSFISATDNAAALFTQYGVPLVGVGMVWFIVWTMNRFKGDFDDRQKLMEQERRKEAMAKVEQDPELQIWKDMVEKMDPEENPDEYERATKKLEKLRAKLEARARFMISEEGGGPGGGPSGGGGQEEAVDKFMKIGGMKVLGKKDQSDAGDAVKDAMAAAAKAKDEDAARKAAKKSGAKTAAEQEKDRPKAKQGKLRSKMIMRDESEVVKFTDVAGIGDAKLELAEIVDFFRKPEKFKASGAQVPKGIMLTGPPGCGKTLLARAVAGESGATFFSLTASEFVEMFVGVGAARVRDLFSQAKKQAPSIIFIDELDAIGRPRGAGGSGNDERDQTLNQLLVELDGFGSDSGVVCIAATNRVDVLDKALVRAGRFDRKITVRPPTQEGRLQILKVHVRDKPLADDVDLDDLAAEMEGFTGAIIANMVNVACLSAAREGRQDICQANFDAAVEAEMLGKMLPIDRGIENDRRIARVHASCAVATAVLLKDVCKLNFITIVPRETNLDGCVSVKDFPEIERPLTLTRGILTRQTRACFVPQLAEEEHYGFDDLSAAAAPYTARAREIVTMMVTAGGMAKEGSMLNYIPTTDQVQVSDFLRTDVVEFLLRTTTVDKYFESDRQAREMLELEHRAARRFVRRQKAAIDAMTDALVEFKSLDDKMMAEIIEKHAVPEPEWEEETGAYPDFPENRPRLTPYDGPMPENSVPATNEWVEM